MYFNCVFRCLLRVLLSNMQTQESPGRLLIRGYAAFCQISEWQPGKTEIL